jgi:hypothetical protein
VVVIEPYKNKKGGQKARDEEKKQINKIKKTETGKAILCCCCFLLLSSPVCLFVFLFAFKCAADPIFCESSYLIEPTPFFSFFAFLQ